MVEGRRTICILVGSEPMARSAAGLTVSLGMRSSGVGFRFRDRLFEGANVEVRVIRARSRLHEEAAVRLTTAVAEGA
jgi:hypothetical protein